MSAQTPTFIETPEPPSDLDTPSEMPGTPNSTTTSLSALSTTAIKDGHRGAPHASSTHPNPHSSTNTLEAERADRISRLAGLERVSLRPSQLAQTYNPNTGSPQPLNHPNPNTNPNTMPNPNQTGFVNQIPGYFDALGNPVYTTKMSTVGTASATGSLGGGGDGHSLSRDSMGGMDTNSMGHRTTTWASSSTRGDGDGDTDMMSMDSHPNYRETEQREQRELQDLDERRYGSDGDGDEDGMSEEGNASLVAFGEGAGSTVSGPTYTRGKEGGGRPGMRSEGSMGSTAPGAVGERERVARLGPLVSGQDDSTGSGFVDTTARSPVPGGAGHHATGSGGVGRGATGVETAERILRERMGDEVGAGGRALGTPEEAGLGKFYFEEKK